MVYVGKYVEEVQTFVVGYTNAADCTSDNGDWDAEMELCFFFVDNEVVVSGNANGYTMTVATWGSNAHSCVFEGPATKVLPNALVSEVPTEIYEYETGEWVPATCEVTVNYGEPETIDVTTNGNCQEFCGMRASLEMGPATLRE